MPPEQEDNGPDRGRGSSGEPPWALEADAVAEGLRVVAGEGLGSDEADRRLEDQGPNSLRETASRPTWRILLEQFRSVVVLILATAGVLSLAFGNLPEGIAIAAVIVVNCGIGFVSEWRATRSMEALREIGRPAARVRRDGREQEVASTSIVPGDVVILDAGDVAPADMRLVEANGLTVDESALTGESVAVGKRTDAVEPDTPLADRTGMLYKGTTVVEGSGEAVVTATGMDTELGRISELAEAVEDEETPLERRLEHLGRRMAVLVLAAAALIAVAGVLVGQPARLIIATAVALGVAAVPEGLPIVANLALARGMWLMSLRQALINRLPAVETLGATDVILTDKTGTLTENRMTVHTVLTPAGETRLDGEEGKGGEGGDGEGDGDGEGEGSDDPLLDRVLAVGVLCSNASLPGGDGQQAQGDPTEVALLRAGAERGLTREKLLEEKPERREEPFDPDVMMMATFHEAGGKIEVAVKGAPSAVLAVCTRQARADGDEAGGDEPLDDAAKNRWTEEGEELAARGLRVLAVADRTVEDPSAEPYEDLRLLGLVGLHDPPREGVGELIHSCHEAGIRVVMVTGDQADTARAISRQVGIVEDEGVEAVGGGDLGDPDELGEEDRRRVLGTDVFARFSPEQKLDLVGIFQDDGHTVAMTGDGINDSPALKKADIGVAMGQRGTDAAREASDMVLQDDAFSSIVSAIRQGRVIFDNIRKSVMFMLCTNVAEVFAVAAASVAGTALPLLPLQILYLNMLTDVLPALALGVGKGEEGVMRRPPRRRGEAILTRRHWLGVGGWGVGIAACVLAALAVGLTGLDLDEHAAVTVSFLTLGFTKLWFVFGLREVEAGWVRNAVTRNPYIWGAIAACAALLVAAVYLPGLSGLLRTRPIGPGGWATVLGLSLLPAATGQALLAVRARLRR